MVSLPFLIATASPLLGLWTGAAIGSEDAVSGPESQPAPKDAKMLAEGVPESPAQRLRREGIRALNNGDPERMSAAGLNLALPWERLLLDARKTTPPDSDTILRPEDFSVEAVERLRTWALKCQKNDIIMIYMMYVAAEPSVRYLTGLEPKPDGHLLDYIGFGGRHPSNASVKKIWPAHQYRHVVDWDGQVARWAPCPLERRYWIGFIRPQLELVARVLKETGARGGAALELETYCFYSIYPGMASQKKTFCYCDECFYGFVRSLSATEAPDAVLPRVRFDWLTQRGLRHAYEQSLETRMAAIIQEMIREVRKINPDFLFGMYPYAPFWYYDALIRGSSTSDLPCLLFPSAEYRNGYTVNPPRTFFGDVPTPASVAHLRRRGFHALYAGGLYDLGIRSPEAYALAMDRLLRAADGYWAYFEGDTEPFWKFFPAINRWNREHPDPLPPGSMRHSGLAEAIQRLREEHPEGLEVEQGHIVACYEGDAGEIPVIGRSFDDEQEVQRGWQGRGVLPPLDEKVVYSGSASLRFEPSAPGKVPQSPFIDQKIPGAGDDPHEISFWVKTDAPAPVRLWVGTATKEQYPAYMWYYNFVLPAQQDWLRLRIAPVSFDVVRFWCPPTEGRLWLDELRLRPVQERIIEAPLGLPQGAVGWGTIDWRLSPAHAPVEAELVAAEEGRLLRKRLYPGDSLAPLMAVVGPQPVRLRLRVYPSAAESVALEEVEVRYVPDPE